MNFGTIGFRASTKIKTSSKVKWENVLERLKEHELIDFIRIKIDNMVFELVASIEEEYGGQFVYVMLNSPTRKLRIYKDFTGDNYRELSKKYKISLNQIRKIINEERKRKNKNIPVQGSFL